MVKSSLERQIRRSTPAVGSTTTDVSDASRSSHTDDYLVQPKLKAQLSTNGSCRTSYPKIDGLELGFALPPTPTDIDEASYYVQSLLKRGGLPSREDYQTKFDGLRQNRLLFRILSDLQICLTLWTRDKPGEATYYHHAKIIPKYQISPLPVCFKTPKTRSKSFEAWYRALSPEASEGEEVQVFMQEEFKAYATVQSSTYNHRPNSTNMYLCSTQDHPSYGQSFSVRPSRNADIAVYEELLADDDARGKHSGRNGSDHEFVVLVDGNHQAYIYDPSLRPAPGVIKGLIKCASETPRSSSVLTSF